MRGGQKTWKHVGGELAAMPAALDLEPILEEVTARLLVIQTATRSAERPHLAIAAKPITDLFGPIAHSGGVPAAGVLRPDDKGQTTLEMLRPQKEALSWLGFDYVELIF
jgi:hypothetical protein